MTGKRAKANRIPDERKRELLEEMPYCPCGRETTEFHHIVTGAGVKSHERSNLKGVCRRCHRMLHAALTPPWSRRQRVEGCAFCDGEKGEFFPPHDASKRCESGHHRHCSCSICF
ncbi:MAG: hypothetical protein DRQ89_14440 [Epsilonproteobacteria bacterium]|nr:MAG: hypothetical protein DRQ89_14440 [Campylobacterota bacterium]